MLYKLTAKRETFNDPMWRYATTGPGECWIRAGDESSARDAVVFSTMQMAERLPNLDSPINPWRVWDYTTCDKAEYIPADALIANPEFELDREASIWFRPENRNGAG